jgi:hypothetical protein
VAWRICVEPTSRRTALSNSPASHSRTPEVAKGDVDALLLHIAFFPPAPSSAALLGSTAIPRVRCGSVTTQHHHPRGDELVVERDREAMLDQIEKNPEIRLQPPCTEAA